MALMSVRSLAPMMALMTVFFIDVDGVFRAKEGLKTISFQHDFTFSPTPYPISDSIILDPNKFRNIESL
jgi:hypothetical protein